MTVSITAHFRYMSRWGGVAGTLTNVGVWSIQLCAPASSVGVDFSGERKWCKPLLHAFERYFGGKSESFADIPLDLEGATPFCRLVWETARQVPWGQTVTYGDLCLRMGKPVGTARAVGQALGANPIPIIVPCHRIVAGGGGLGGFSGGIEWKIALLRLEGLSF